MGEAGIEGGRIERLFCTTQTMGFDKASPKNNSLNVPFVKCDFISFMMFIFVKG